MELAVAETGVDVPRASGADASGTFLHRYRFAILLGLTALAAGMRLFRLTSPPLWGDEALTYSRVCGTFRELLAVLKDDGFPPLHYELYWLIQRWHGLSPVAMRMPAAIAGTLMVPAMYFLASQFVRRSATALLVAAFTCCSAYMMVYSRDAKMYEATWLLVALNVALLVCWLRTRRRIAWWAWIATGLAVVGMHVSAWGVFAIEPVIVLTYNRRWPRWQQCVLLVVGLLIVAAGPAGYVWKFNTLDKKVEKEGFARGSDLGWIEGYNRERNGAGDLALYTSTAFLVSWEWPDHATQKATPGIEPDLMHGLMIVCTVLLVGMAAGVLPWRRRAAVEGVEWRSPLWVLLWLILPAYGLYCSSVRRFASPVGWVEPLGDLFHRHWVLFGGVVVALCLAAQYRRSLTRVLAIGVPVIGGLLLAMSFMRVLPSAGVWHGGAWHAAYWPAIVQWWDLVTDERGLAVLLAICIAIAWANAGMTLRQRAMALVAFAGVACVILGACYGIYRYEQHQFEQRVVEQMGKRKPSRWDLLPVLKDHGVPSREVARKVFAERYPGASAEAIERRADDAIAIRQARWDSVRARAATTRPSATAEQLDSAAAERVLAEETVWDGWISVWMPRYLGMCWPAFAVAGCTLLMRLPGAGLRYSVIALLLGANVAQSAGRIFADTEPPMQRVYGDVLAAQDQRGGQPSGSTTRAYFYNVGFISLGDPGSVAMFGFTARYYATRLMGIEVKPAQFRAMTMFLPTEPWHLRFSLNPSPLAIGAELAKSPQVERVIIWEKLPGGAPLTQPPPRLPGGWGVRSDEQFAGRVHWTWQRGYTLRRVEYERGPLPTTTGPTTAPATQP